MALAIQQGQSIRGKQAIAERPDGSRVPFLAFPTPLFNDAGEMVGAVNMLMDIGPELSAENVRQKLSAIVESSDDAIISIDIDYRITSWNRGAERLFGYLENEVIGENISLIIPDDRRSEEPQIVDRIKAGEHIEHYETVRKNKDGLSVHVSLSVSPIRDASGKVVGCAKIARDMGYRRRLDEQKDLLLGEMNHRVKNLFSLAIGLVNLTKKEATTPEDMAANLRGKFLALSHAHSLTMVATKDIASENTLHTLIAAITSPYQAGRRIAVRGLDLPLGRNAMTNMALLFHELSTNSVKYGALRGVSGQIEIECLNHNGFLTIVWKEKCSLAHIATPENNGFGSRLVQAAVSSVSGSFTRDFVNGGLVVSIKVPIDQMKN